MDKLYFIVQNPDLNPYSAGHWTTKLSKKGDAITIQHPMHDTFMFTMPVGFSAALGDADGEVTNSARKIALSTTMRKAIDGALLTETVNVGGRKTLMIRSSSL